MASTVGNAPLAAVFVGTGLLLLLASGPLARYAARRWPATRLRRGQTCPHLRDALAVGGAAMAISQTLFYFGQGIAGMVVNVLWLVFLVIRTKRARADL